MKVWSIIAELQALILLCIIGSFFFENRNPATHRNKLFGTTLLLAVGSVLLDLLCVSVLEDDPGIPGWVHLTGNSLYFLISVWMCTGAAFYLVDLLLEHVCEKSFQKKAGVVLCLLNMIFLAAVLVNIRTGSLFWIDSQGGYHRGGWNGLGYVTAALELGVVLLCCRRYRRSVSPKAAETVRILPLLLLLLAGCQMAVPEMLPNGIAMAAVLLILYIRFQSCQVEKDPLTNLGNQKTFYEELFLKVQSRQKLQVILIVLHGFEQVRQLYGHRQGDAFLYRIGRWLGTADPEWNAYRVGDTAFAMLCPFESEEREQRRLEQAAERFRNPWSLDRGCCEIQASCCGLVWTGQPWDADRIAEYLKVMQQMAKEQPRKILRFTRKTEQQILFRKTLKEQLERAIREQQFELYFQPIYDCRRKRFSSAEVLLRLRDDEGVFISPAVFIPYAEELGLLEEISWIVLKKTCRFLEKNRNMELDSVSINLSVQQLQEPEAARRILGELQDHSIVGKRLIIEITEREMASDQKKVREVMQLLAERGVRFYLDDFGTGYSNFSMVMHLPFTCIKLDRSLLEKIADSEKDRRMIQTMGELFHNGGFGVVSEGVEDEAQAVLLQRLGMDFIQGFYYARPMPETEFVRFMEAHRVS